MRIAILSDIHGNRRALEAVLADGREAGVQQWWVLGDLCALGSDPAGCLGRLRSLDDAWFVRGNTDRYLVDGDRPPPSFDDVRTDTGLLGRLVQMNSGFAWTQGVVTATGHMQWLADLPLDQRETLPCGTRVLAVHARPGYDDGAGVTGSTPDDVLEAMLASAEADLVLVAHTHHVVDRTVNGVRVVNSGSVSNPPRGRDPRASYAVLDAHEKGYEILHRWVDYDRRAAAEDLHQVRFPGADFVAPMLWSATK